MTRPDEMLAMHESPPTGYYAQLEDGRILSVGNDGMFRTSEDGGISWSEPSERRDANGDPVGPGATSLVKLSGKGVGLITNPRPSGNQHAMFWRSDDEGENWAAPVRATPERESAYIVSTDVMMRTSSGRIVIPVYNALGKERDASDHLPSLWGKLVNGQWVGAGGHFSDPRFTSVYVCYSDDEGRTWQRNEDGELIIVLDWNANFNFVNEASVAEVAPGHLLMIMRTGLGRLFQAWSHDDGTTWSRPMPTSLAASTTPAYIASLPEPGHLLVVWNQHGEEEIKQGFSRTRMSSAVSRNGGSVWEFFQNVESWHEETRVEPGPIRAVRPTEYDFDPGLPAAERDAKHITGLTPGSQWGWRITYPRVNVFRDRVFIQYGYDTYSEHPTQAEHVVEKGSRLKILPFSWFYGGKEPANNAFLRMPEFPTS